MLNAGIIWNVVVQRELLAVLGLTVVLAWPLGRLGRGLIGPAFVMVLGALLAATTTKTMPYYSVRGVEIYLKAFTELGGVLKGFAGNEEKLANMGLFVPLGAVATLLWRRPVVVLGAAAVLSFAIEGWQGFIGRGGDPVDVAHNSAGALLGVGAALAMLASKHYRAGRSLEDRSRTG